MNIRQAKELLKKTCKAGLPVMIKGAPGVGKTDMIYQVGADIGFDVWVSHPAISDPTDFKGQPWVVNGKATFLPFGDLLKLIDAKKPTIAFMDDLGQAPATVQAAAMQLILARHVNGHKVSDKVVFVAATNRREDRAGVTGILEPVKSRFATIIELHPDPQMWIEWALANNQPQETIGFIHFRPEMLFKPAPTADIVNSPNPRTMSHCGKLINAGVTETEAFIGAIGEGAAVELAGFVRIYKSLPSIDSIILNPTTAKVPTEPAALYAITSALVHNAGTNNLERIFQYAERLPKDFEILLGRDITRKDVDDELTKTKPFIKWITKYQDILMGKHN